MDNQPDSGNGKITIDWKWRDEEGQLDLSNPNDLETAKRLINQGKGYEKGQVELKTVKSEKEQAEQQVEYWNQLIEDARDSGDPSKVAGALESVGVKLSKKDSGDEEVIIDAGEQKIQELAKEIESLKNGMYNNWANDTHSQLEAKYSDGNYPEYNRKEVEDYANKKGIRDFEDAYFVMNKEDIMKVQAKANDDKGKKHADKIRNVASKEPGSGTIPAKPIEKYKDYGKASEGWTSDPGLTENLFIDESQFSLINGEQKWL